MHICTQHVLLFPRGELGWHKDILLRGLPEPLNCRHNGDSSDEDGKMLTIAKYHCYQCFTYDGEAQTLFKSGKLFQQYTVDAGLQWSNTGSNGFSITRVTCVCRALQPDGQIHLQAWTMTSILQIEARKSSCLLHSLGVRATLMTKPQPKDTQGDKG